MTELMILEQKNAVVKTNFEDVKNHILTKREEYRGLVVTEDNLKSSKQSLSELTGARTKIDALRKKIKKELSVEIDDTDKKFKELISLITEVEEPLKADIETFNDKTREKRKKQALEFIEKEVAEQGLLPEFASKLVIKDFYLNLTGTQKEVKEDIKKEAIVLKEQQMKLLNDRNVISSEIASINNDLLTPLDETEFLSLLPSKDVNDILTIIRERAEQLKKAEALAAEKAKAELEEARIKAEAEAIKIPEIIAPETTSNQESLQFDKTAGPQMPFIPTAPTQDIWQVNLVLTGNMQELREFNQFLKEKQIAYRILSQGKL